MTSDREMVEEMIGETVPPVGGDSSSGDRFVRAAGTENTVAWGERATADGDREVAMVAAVFGIVRLHRVSAEIWNYLRRGRIADFHREFLRLRLNSKR
jgi:hypothetical protein